MDRICQLWKRNSRICNKWKAGNYRDLVQRILFCKDNMYHTEINGLLAVCMQVQNLECNGRVTSAILYALGPIIIWPTNYQCWNFGSEVGKFSKYNNYWQRRTYKLWELLCVHACLRVFTANAEMIRKK